MQFSFLPTIGSDDIINDILRKLNKQGHNRLIPSCARGVPRDACIPGAIAGKLGKNLVVQEIKRKRQDNELVKRQGSTKGVNCFTYMLHNIYKINLYFIHS